VIQSARVSIGVFEWIEPPVERLRRTPLHDWHVAAGARMVPFAGWRMPVWYGSAAQEHRIVREAAGLFDVGHMGAIEVSGPRTAAFLDALTTNAVEKIQVGDAQYTYLLDVDGVPLDDLILYRTADERVLLVVNAANEAKVWAWLNAVNERRVLIDRDDPARVAPGPVALRNLKDPAHGADRRLDLALQGNASLPTLRALTGSADLEALPKFNHRPARCGSIEVLLSRTGYTGQNVGFEILVHPDRAVELWTAILEAGRGPGVRAVGLAARDSTRTEAGFPLYGHELGGPRGLTPLEAGYGAFVKLDKPFFVGRRAILERRDKMTRAIARFEVLDEDARAVRADDEVLGPDGAAVGVVTSCAAIGRRQVGLALVEREHGRTGAEISIRRKERLIRARVLKRFASF
jgi:glycine hydroxymethyltransferase